MSAHGPLHVVLEHREHQPELVLRDDRGVAEVLRVHDPAFDRVVALLQEDARPDSSRLLLRDDDGVVLEVRSAIDRIHNARDRDWSAADRADLVEALRRSRDARP
jgi:hypothetical protein